MSDDLAAVQALFAPVIKGELSLPPKGRALYMNARFHRDMDAALAGMQVDCVQYFKAYADGLGEYSCTDTVEAGIYDAAFVNIPKDMDEARMMAARAINGLKADGVLVCAAPNKAGGGRLQKMLQAFGAQQTEHLSAHKCRAVWGRGFAADDALAAALAAGQQQRICDGAYLSQPGLYGWDKVDKGSALLAAHLPERLSGRRVADFGCGYGYLTQLVAQRLDAPFKLYALDADKRAVDVCALNAPSAEPLWVDITRDALPKNLDMIVMNPPFHEGKKTDTGIGKAFISRAAQALRDGGTLWMVANSHLPYEPDLTAHFKTADKLHEGQGFKVYRAVK